jgi:hypothetical protein
MFGNMTDDDIRRTIGFCAQLCAHGGTVIWTRSRQEPDQVPRICDWFAEGGFALVWVSDPAEGWGVGAHRFTVTRCRSSAARACSGSSAGPRH